MASPGNDTDVKIASKAVAIKSNTRLKKLVRGGDLLKMEVNKKKKKEKMSARKTCSPDIYNGVMVRVKPARFTLFQEREARKRNEEQIERNSNFSIDGGIRISRSVNRTRCYNISIAFVKSLCFVSSFLTINHSVAKQFIVISVYCF